MTLAGQSPIDDKFLELVNEALTGETKFDPRDPNILDKIAKSYETKLVGEPDKIKFLVACYMSKDLPRKYRLHATIASQSSAGKSSLIRTVAEPFERHVIEFTSLTPAYVRRMKVPLDGKILLLEQMEQTNEENQTGVQNLKFLMSEGKIITGLVERN